MATKIRLISEKREDNYELELSRVREKIKSKFVELIDCLEARESDLLGELDNILVSYLSYRSALEKVNEKKIALETTKMYHQITKESLEHMLLQINTELKSIETPTEPKMVTFECDSNRMFAELNKLGKLVDKVRSGIDYPKQETTSSECLCERKGNGTT